MVKHGTIQDFLHISHLCTFPSGAFFFFFLRYDCMKRYPLLLFHFVAEIVHMHQMDDDNNQWNACSSQEHCSQMNFSK